MAFARIAEAKSICAYGVARGYAAVDRTNCGGVPIPLPITPNGSPAAFCGFLEIIRKG